LAKSKNGPAERGRQRREPLGANKTTSSWRP
jgi:hypothetical protein